MLIRTATPQDWPRIHPIFASVVAAGESYSYPPDLSSDDARDLWMEQAPGRCVVALRGEASVEQRIPEQVTPQLATPEHEVHGMRDGRPGAGSAQGDVLGTAHMGPNRPGRGSHIATASFMVAPDLRHTGVGRALGEYVVRWARDQGYRGIQFNAVVETNTPAVNLWQSMGFEIIGTVPGAFQHARFGYVGLHVMFLSLT